MHIFFEKYKILPGLLLFILLSSISGWAQNNPCGIKAIFSNEKDTIVTNGITIDYTNISQNATSIQWLLDGNPYYYTTVPNTFELTSSSVGIHKIQLVISNGKCEDTATCYLVISGILPHQKLNSDMALGIFELNYKNYFQHTPYNIDTLANNNYILSGKTQKSAGFVTYSENGLMISITDSGCVNWAKTLPYPNSSIISSKQAINGDILSICNGTFPQSPGNILIRTTASGNLIWAKAISQTLFINNVKEDNSQNIIITANYGVNQGIATGFYLLKLDKTGTVLWTKLMQKKAQQTYTNYTQINDILPIGKDYYISGYTGMYATARNDGFLTKINGDDGSVLWSKLYSPYAGRTTYFNDLHLLNNRILINASTTDIVGGSNAWMLYLYADTSGNILQSYQLNNSDFNLAAPYSSRIVPVPNNGFYLTFYGYEPFGLQAGYQYHSNIIKVSDQNAITWQNTFSNSSHDNYIASALGDQSGIILLGTAYSSLFNTTMPGNTFLLTKIDSMGTTNSFCNFSIANCMLQSIGCIGNPLNWNYDSVVHFTMTDIPVQLKEVNIFKRWICPDAIDSCTLLQIVGPTNACDLKASYTYRVHTLGSCGYQLFTPKNVNLISQTDSTFTVSFSAQGSYNLKISNSNNCSPFTDSIQVIAAPLTYAFTLGPDITICKGQAITLNAGLHYVSYKWQDGSTDLLYPVSDTGTYYVTVLDSCGNIGSDTIHISSALPVYIDALQNQKICLNDSVTLQASKIYKSYSWSPTIGLITIDSTRVRVKPATTTTYRMNAIDYHGCTITDTTLIQVMPLPTVFLGKDTILCIGNSLVLDAGNSFSSYAWNTGSSSSSIVVSGTRIYSVTVTDNNTCTTTDSIMVSVQSIPVFSLGKDSLLCGQETLTLKTDSTGNYLWQDGSVAKQFLVKSAGLYWLQIGRGDCTFRDSITITYSPGPIVHLPADTILCNNATLLLDATQPGNTAIYNWQNGFTGGVLTVSTRGVYSVSVTDNGCTLKYISLIQCEQSPVIYLGKDTTKCIGTILHFDLSHAGASYLWQDLSTSPAYDISKQGTYYCTESNYCGSVTDTLLVMDQDCQCLLSVPNAFSPNGDGINDEFRTSSPCFPTYYHMMIYDRYGQFVFESKDANVYWNGTIKGKPVPIGTYYYLLKVKNPADTEYKQKSGAITLLR